MRVYKEFLLLLFFIFVDFSASAVNYIVVRKPPQTESHQDNPLLEKIKTLSEGFDSNSYDHYQNTQPDLFNFIKRTLTEPELRTRPCKSFPRSPHCANKRITTPSNDYPDYGAAKKDDQTNATNSTTTEDPDPYFPDWDPGTMYETDNPEYEPLRFIKALINILTVRSNRKFSDDYLDFQEMFKSRSKKELNFDEIIKVKSPDLTEREAKIMQKSLSVVAKYLYRILKNSQVMQSARKAAANDTSLGVQKAYESDSEESTKESVEIRSKRKKKRNGKARKPKRFQVINDSASLNDDSKSSGDESKEYEPLSEEVTTRKPKKSNPRKPGRPDTVMQAATRFYKEGKDFRKFKEFRRRELSFMPKRYHWDVDDYPKLGYFWFNGPQGRNPGPWRIVY